MPKRPAPYKSSEELRKMTTADLDAYLAWLRWRLDGMLGPARKIVEKRLAVAKKIRALR